MNDEQLSDTWTTLGPTVTQRRRIDSRVSSWLDAYDTSLAAEWRGLFTASPFPALGLAAVSAVGLIFATPLVWFARAFAAALM